MRTQIGSYRIDGILGNGGMGVVYKAWHGALGRHAAIKTFLPKSGADSELRQRLLSEARAQALLQHPNIVAVHDYFEHDGEWFIVMEYVDGQTLAQVLDDCADGRMPLDAALPLIGQILDALEYIHSQSTVHRDVKPSNVMVCRGCVKLMDFGIALREGAPRLTASRHAPGTPLYMSPEQLQAKDVDQRTDVYSAAILFYRMFAGRVPFDSKEPMAGLHQRFAGPVDLQTLAPELPAGVCRAIAMGLEFDVEKRFRSAAALRDAIREGAAGFLPVEAETVEDLISTQPIHADVLPERPTESRARRGSVAVWSIVGVSLATGTAVLVDKLSQAPVTHASPPRTTRAQLVAPQPAIDLELFERQSPIQPAAPPPPNKETPVFPHDPVVPAHTDRDVDTLREAIVLGLQHAANSIDLAQFDSAIAELDGVVEKIQRYPDDFGAEAERARALRANATEGLLAEARRKQQEAMWQARIADVESDLQKERWLEVQRFAQDILDDHAPEPFATRARELLRLGIEGHAGVFAAEGKVGATTNTIVRKPGKKN